MKKTLFIVNAFYFWQQIKDNQGIPLEDTNGSLGCLIVFENKEDAEKRFPNVQIDEVDVIVNDENLKYLRK